jgi:uncharacterized oxidoreductase
MDIQGKHATVTGGGTGIGLACARALKASGATVTICGRRKDVLEQVAKAEGFKHAVLDVTDDASVKKFTQRRKVDILVNNAGIMNMTRVDAKDAVEIAEKEFGTNVIGMMRLTHALMPKVSTIVNISSGLAYVPWPSAPSYCATKAAVHSWTESLRHQLDNVEVFEVLPPLTNTTMVTDVEIGMKKVAPEEIATAMIKGMQKGRYEIPVGSSKALRAMNRMAPNFIRKQLANS